MAYTKGISLRSIFQAALALVGMTAVLAPHVKAQGPTCSAVDSGPWATTNDHNQRANRSLPIGPSNPNTLILAYDAGTSYNVTNVTVTSNGKILVKPCSAQVAAWDFNGKALGSARPYQLLPSSFPTFPDAAVGLTVINDGDIYRATHECPDIHGGIPDHFYSAQTKSAITSAGLINVRAIHWTHSISSKSSVFSCAAAARLTYKSSIKDVAITKAKFAPEGLTALVANTTDDDIVLLRGIVCVDKEPGDNPQKPGDGCREIYFGSTFPPHESAWSKPQCLDLPSTSSSIVSIRLLKVQSVTAPANIR